MKGSVWSNAFLSANSLQLLFADSSKYNPHTYVTKYANSQMPSVTSKQQANKETPQEGKPDQKDKSRLSEQEGYSVCVHNS